MNSSVTPIDTNPMRLTHNTHCSNKKSHLETAQSSRIISSSQLASARAVMFKRPHLPCQQKQTKARTCLSKGRHFENFNFGQSYESTGFGGDLGTYLLPIPFVRVPLQEHQVRPIFYDLDLPRIWTNWCGSLRFLFPRERTRFNKKPLKCGPFPRSSFS